MMKAFIDRIEDGNLAVLLVKGIGEIIVPVKLFQFKVHEGMHLSIEMKPDPKSESATLSEIQKLQQKLLKKSKGY